MRAAMNVAWKIGISQFHLRSEGQLIQVKNIPYFYSLNAWPRTNDGSKNWNQGTVLRHPMTFTAQGTYYYIFWCLVPRMLQ